MKLTYKHTLVSCFIGYIVQAISCNFIPLLFVTFQTDYHMSLTQLTALVSVSFVVQLIVDVTAPLYLDKVGYRPCIIAAHVFSAAGLTLLTLLPEILPPFAGLLTAVLVYSMGSGLIEVLVSPITESCPTDNKEKAMSLLHSFYSWGYMGVVLLSTAFFAVFGVENWKILALIWSVIPIINGIFFVKVPLVPLIKEGERGMTVKELFKKPVFWLMLTMMFCAGASEHAVCQWASAFAEKGLGISKTLGDLAGPMAFAFLMGSTRALYGKYGDKINLQLFIAASAALCILSYCLIVFVNVPWVNLVGCALTGISIAIMWPGTLSISSAALRNGGTTMFALLAVAGDLGCSSGPGVVGTVSGIFGENLKIGILAAMAIPALMLVCALLCLKKK